MGLLLLTKVMIYYNGLRQVIFFLQKVITGQDYEVKILFLLAMY